MFPLTIREEEKWPRQGPTVNGKLLLVTRGNICTFTATYLQEEGLKDLCVWRCLCWLAWHYYKQNVSVKQTNVQKIIKKILSIMLK